MYEDGSIEPEIDPLLLEAGVKSDGTLKISDKPDQYAHLTRPPTPPEEEEEIIVLTLEELIEIVRISNSAGGEHICSPVAHVPPPSWVICTRIYTTQNMTPWFHYATFAFLFLFSLLIWGGQAGGTAFPALRWEPLCRNVF